MRTTFAPHPGRNLNETHRFKWFAACATYSFYVHIFITTKIVSTFPYCGPCVPLRASPSHLLSIYLLVLPFISRYQKVRCVCFAPYACRCVRGSLCVVSFAFYRLLSIFIIIGQLSLLTPPGIRAFLIRRLAEIFTWPIKFFGHSGLHFNGIGHWRCFLLISHSQYLDVDGH